MGDYDEMTNIDVMSVEEMREYEQAGEARLDALDEERWAEEAAAAEKRDEYDEDDDEFDGEER